MLMESTERIRQQIAAFESELAELRSCQVAPKRALVSVLENHLAALRGEVLRLGGERRRR
ncbi:MAG TPA: hypothetical protein VGC36_11950 [Rhizomicrobium sp.]